MDHKNLLINILKNKDLVAFKKYDEISRRLSNKDSRYLIENNLNIIKQYGGKIITVNKQGDGVSEKYYLNIKEWEEWENRENQNELMKVKVGTGKLKGVKKLNIQKWKYRGFEGLKFTQSNGRIKIGFNGKTFDTLDGAETIAKIYINLYLKYNNQQIVDFFYLLNKNGKLEINPERVYRVRVKDNNLFFLIDGTMYKKMYINNNRFHIRDIDTYNEMEKQSKILTKKIKKKRK